MGKISELPVMSTVQSNLRRDGSLPDGIAESIGYSPKRDNDV
jgi:hypothetical protein